MKNLNLATKTTILALGIGALTAAGAQAQGSKANMARAITLTGIVGGHAKGKEFFLRANGETFRVQPLPSVGMSGVRGGDRVRVFGRPDGLIISSANVRVLSSRASDSASDYNPPPGTTIQNPPNGRNGAPARTTTHMNAAPTSNQGMANQGMANQGAMNSGVGRNNRVGSNVTQVVPGFNTPGVVSSGAVVSGVVTPGVVRPGVIIPGVGNSNAIRRNATK